jgi:hypothetical protein
VEKEEEEEAVDAFQDRIVRRNNLAAQRDLRNAKQD